MGIFDF